MILPMNTKMEFFIGMLAHIIVNQKVDAHMGKLIGYIGKMQVWILTVSLFKNHLSQLNFILWMRGITLFISHRTLH